MRKDTTPNPTRRRGRPKKNEPSIPWNEIEHLLVHGETVETQKGPAIHFPSYRELAERFNLSHPSISKFSKQHNCLGRRKKTQQHFKETADLKLAEKMAERHALTKDDLLELIDEYVIKFRTALREDRVRIDNPTDLNSLIRLRVFIVGDAESRDGEIPGLTLEDLQERYEETTAAYKATTPEMRGEVMPNEDDGAEPKI